jgi:hypothetical protein
MLQTKVIIDTIFFLRNQEKPTLPVSQNLHFLVVLTKFDIFYSKYFATKRKSVDQRETFISEFEPILL